MLDRAFRWRVALIVSGLLLGGIAVLTGLMSPKKAIVIDYGMYPDEFVGAEVFIDDEPVGRLERITAAARSGFEVEDGAHVVRIVHPELDCQPIRVETQGSQMNVTLRLDIADFYDPGTQRSKPTIVFQ